MKVHFISILAALVLVSVGSISFNSEKQPKQLWADSASVIKVLNDLGEPMPSHYKANPSKELVQQGKDFIFNGRTKDSKGKMSQYISKHFMCTSCHNTVREDLDLTKTNAEQRLAYAEANKLPYLQGSTFWGIVNRETWYNDDYVKKYGDLVAPARESLVEAIQLCATSCAQGRELEDWEVESILAYFSTLDLKIGDLQFSEAEWGDLQLAFNRSHEEAIVEYIESAYQHKSPATFSNPPKSKETGYGLQGRPNKGIAIYDLGCKHCHHANGESDVVLDDAKKTFKWLKNHMFDNTQLSIYEIIRHGTYAEYGHRPYMPHYTEEKMSHQQVEDLRAYIEEQAR